MGFVLTLYRQVPLFLDGLEPDRGWITAFGVHPEHRRQGVGRALFEAAGQRLAGRRVLISPYTPNYFVPGVDADAYPDALAFLERMGWQVVSEPISMRADLEGYAVSAEAAATERRLAAAEGVTVRPVRSEDLPALLPFISGEFGWDWYRLAQERLLQIMGPGCDDSGVLVAVRGLEVVGYCQHHRERFGPFGVAASMRGQGIGRVLLEHCLADMLARGFHCAWFLWTGRDAARAYARSGFRTVRQFKVFSRTMPGIRNSGQAPT